MEGTLELSNLSVLVEVKPMHALKLRSVVFSIVFLLFTATVQALDIASAQEGIVVIETDTGQGSGVLLESSGVIITNLHVIEDASDISVRIHTNERYDDVDVIDVDETKDLALLKIKGFDLPTVRLGNSNSVKSGQDVFAIGAPRGLEQTVSRGIISAVRDMDGGFKSIQTDAAISPGSSGGGLFNESSELIAILAAYRGDGQNLNFAIPINYVRGMMGQPVRFTEAEFVDLNWQTPTFGEAASASTNLEKVRRWTRKLANESDIEITEVDDRSFVAIVGEMGILVRLIDDLLWVFMPLADALGQEFELTRQQLAEWLELSNEINYAYISLDENNPSVAYELNVGGSSYEAFELGFFAVLGGAMKVIEAASVTAAEPDSLRKPAVEKNYDSGGLRYVEPNDIGVELGFRAFVWNAEEIDGGYRLNSKRGDEKWVSVFVEPLEVEVEPEEGLYTILANYLEGLEDASLVSRGLREVQSLPSVWGQYTQTTEGLKLYYYSAAVLFPEHLVTIHTWSSEPEWQAMDETLVEFLSNIRYRP